MLDPSAGLVVNSKYLLEAPLARGGMGSVWTATHRELGVRVALKFMDPAVAATEGGGARFEREAKAAAHLESRHIVQVRDYGVADGTPYLVMELLRGESLEQRLRDRTRLRFDEVTEILRQLAKGLKQAHEAGIVHRDLKPGNIFLARVDDEDVLKILDFGIAKLSHATPDANATRTGTMMGSVHYASPEQLRNSKDADARSDLWSVGVILFRMLVGELPFRGMEIADVIVKVCAEPIPRPTSMAPNLPPHFDAFFERALSRDPRARFQTITELLEAFVRLGVAQEGSQPIGTTLALTNAFNASSGGAVSVSEPATAQLVPTLEDKTAVWAPPGRPVESPPHAFPYSTPDTTLRGPGATANTASPQPAELGSRRALVLVGAVGLLISLVSLAWRVVWSERDAPTGTATISATSATDPGLTQTVVASVGTTSDAPTGSTLTIAPASPTASASALVQPNMGQSPATSIKTATSAKTPPTATSSPKKTPKTQDNDVDMP